MVTINDIAELAGVAKSTVSRYLNNGQVSETTRIKIEKVIRETGYKPNPFARSLKAQHTYMIGVIIPRLNSPSTNNVLGGIDEEAHKRGYQLIITNSNQDDEREAENIDMLTKQKVAGIIIFGREINDALAEKVRQSSIPILVLGQEINGVHSIVHADYQAGKKMAEHALALGHRKILFVGVTSKDYAVGVLRKNGFIEEAQKNGATVQTIETTFSKKDTYQKALKFLKNTQATYIACATDNIAIAVLKAAYELGYKVPEDFSLSGFGGYESTNYVNPAITTVTYPYWELGIYAMDNLRKLLKTQEIPETIEMKNELNIKASTRSLTISKD